MKSSTFRLLTHGKIAKGDVAACARISAIQAAKRACELIPLCHPVKITNVSVEFTPVAPNRVTLTVKVSALDRTGVEMEAMTGAAVAALVVYDMCKAVERGMTIEKIMLLEKSGGRSGTYVARRR
ncbi:MAG: cyclic pyranopterin monophosphate synthase MoaC, partial [Planctomycetota bacterium]|nr:cyclic pyranopterin monophosphate synthase MoaC [Planctomycetota bacterium]